MQVSGFYTPPEATRALAYLAPIVADALEDYAALSGAGRLREELRQERAATGEEPSRAELEAGRLVEELGRRVTRALDDVHAVGAALLCLRQGVLRFPYLPPAGGFGWLVWVHGEPPYVCTWCGVGAAWDTRRPVPLFG